MSATGPTFEALEFRTLLSVAAIDFAADTALAAHPLESPASPASTEMYAAPMNDVIVDYASPILLTTPGQTYQLQHSMRFAGNGFYIAAPNVTLDLNGQTIYYGGGNTNIHNNVLLGAHGVVLYLGWHNTELSIPGATNPINAIIKNGRIVHEGTGAVSHAVYGYQPNNVIVDDIWASAHGTDSHAIFFAYGTGTVINSVLTSHAVDSFNRHSGPAAVRGYSLTAMNNIVIGGNSGIATHSNSAIRENVIAHNGFVTNGYGVFMYRANDMVIEDNLILPTNGRGIVLNGGSNNHVTGNVILHLEAPNAEYGSVLNPPAIRSRYDTSGNIVSGNTALGIAGGGIGLTAASGLYLTDDGTGEPSTFADNDLTTILVGARASNHYAQPITFEGQGYIQQSNNVISGNIFRSNDALVRVQGYDGSLQAAAPVVGNSFEWIDGNGAVAGFAGAIMAKLSDIQMNDNPYALQVVNEAIDRIHSLILGVPLNTNRGTWFLKDGWGPTKVDGTFLDNNAGSGVALDSFVYQGLSNGEVSVKIGQTVPVVLHGAGGALPSASALVTTDRSDSYDYVTNVAGGFSVPVIEFALEKAFPAGSPILKVGRATTTITVEGYLPAILDNDYLLSHKDDPSPLIIQLVPLGSSAPQANNNAYSTNEDSVLSVPAAGVLANDSDPNQSPLTAVLVAGPAHGTLQLNPDGSFTYTPTANYHGADSFSYRAYNGNEYSNIATVSITVVSVNDPPLGTSTTVTTLEDTPYVFTVTNFGFSDPHDSPPNTLLAVRIASLPAAGALTLNGNTVSVGQSVPAASISTGLLRFTPAANAYGTSYASFTFQVQDNGGTVNGGIDLDPNPKTITVNVTSVNDPPSGTSTTVSTLEDTPYVFTVANFGFSDPQDSPPNTLLAVRIASLPAAGALTLNGTAVSVGQFIPAANIASGLLRFTPAANAHGTSYASFTFQVQDNGGTVNGGIDLDPNPKTITVNVTSVNDPPSGTSTTVTTFEDTPYVFTVANFGFSDPHDAPPNTLLAVRIASLPAAGALTLNGTAVSVGQFIPAANISAGLFRFTPAANAHGTGYASFTFQVRDDGGTANGGIDLDPNPKTITVNVTATEVSTGVVGYWQFNTESGQPAFDSSGVANHGELQGGARLGDGQTGYSLMMTTASQGAYVPPAPSLNITEHITMAAWIAPSTSGTQSVIKKAVAGSVNGYELSLSNAGKVFVRFNQVSSGDAFRVDSTSNYPTNGSTWMHVVATYDGAEIRLYINGQLQGSKAAVFTIQSNQLGLGIGIEPPGTRGMRGRIDDALVANRALSAAEVAALYEGNFALGEPVNQPPTVNAGPDLTTQVGTAVGLMGSVSDDGLPSPANLTVQWSLLSGPGTVDFVNPSAAVTDASFSQAGTYFLRLMASDGQLTATDDVMVTVSQIGASTDIVGFWRFNEGSGAVAHDASGNGNHGFIPTNGFGDGQTGYSLMMTTAPQGAYVPPAPSLNVTEHITMAAWIAPSTSATQSVIKKAVAGSANGYELSLSNAGKVFVRFNQVSSGDTFRVDSSSNYPTNGSTWMHVAATYDGQVIRLYINGQLQGSKAAVFTIQSNQLGLGIGIEPSGTRGMRGRIDDALVANRAFTPAEIEALYQGTFQQGEPSNQPPSVSAGLDLTAYVDTPVVLNGSASDDGLPAPANLSVQWTLISGPGSVIFGNASSPMTTASFSAPGDYTLRLSADDGQLTAEDHVVVSVIAAPSTSDIVGYWKFDEGTGTVVSDSSFTGNVGSLAGGASLGAGYFGGGMTMASADGRLFVPHSPSLDVTNSATISAWIAPASSGTQTVVKKASHNAINGYELSLANSGKVFVRFNQSSSGDTFRLDSTTNFPTNGSTWMHVVATYDGAVMRLYVNGELETSKPAVFTIATNFMPLGIGAEPNGARGMVGRIDEVLIANRALTASEVTALYQGSFVLGAPMAQSMAMNSVDSVAFAMSALELEILDQSNPLLDGELNESVAMLDQSSPQSPAAITLDSTWESLGALEILVDDFEELTAENPGNQSTSEPLNLPHRLASLTRPASGRPANG